MTRVYVRDCVECDKTFAGRTKQSVICSDECRSDRVRRRRKAYNDANYERLKPQLLAAAHARRARLRAVESERIDIAYLARRDKWRCGICKQKVLRNVASSHPLGPSIDHMIPICPRQGEPGTNTLRNVQLAHYSCNLRKKNRGGGEQLALIG